ncbi:nucleotidyl transferase AbiEii/AbiGii toxin family protein [Undibacterium sp. Tian12W]|uniref:nucleotidyl transferase AbiEii/AbiGii toxin family protein n=1 Tax=Undibacterium sp. Tian12W TaxID=3413054 RepID=UPI003BF1D1ED
MSSSNLSACDVSPAFLAGEAFIRRAASLDLPFMLKGSFLTRQYFQDPAQRIPADLDWVCMQGVVDATEARTILDPWAVAVTEAVADDDIRFRSFRKNAFWRRIDYAMAEDFPTVNTDLAYSQGDAPYDEISMDVSLNLDLAQGPVPLLYRPVLGDAFLIKNTVPLSLQIAWKIHQTLVRPRFKDLFDLGHLLQHREFDEVTHTQMRQALERECQVGKVDMQTLTYFLSGDIARFFPNCSIEKNWNLFRHNQTPSYHSYADILAFDRADQITDASKLPHDLSDFLEQFHAILMRTGLVEGGAACPPVRSGAQIVTFFMPPKRLVPEIAEPAPAPEQNDNPIYGRADNAKKGREFEAAFQFPITSRETKALPEKTSTLENWIKKIKALF